MYLLWCIFSSNTEWEWSLEFLMELSTTWFEYFNQADSYEEVCLPCAIKNWVHDDRLALLLEEPEVIVYDLM